MLVDSPSTAVEVQERLKRSKTINVDISTDVNVIVLGGLRQSFYLQLMINDPTSITVVLPSLLGNIIESESVHFENTVLWTCLKAS